MPVVLSSGPTMCQAQSLSQRAHKLVEDWEKEAPKL